MISSFLFMYVISFRITALLEGRSTREGGGLRCQLDVEDEQQRLFVRERHAVGLRGMAPDLRDEPFLVRCAGLEPALARDHRCHSHPGEARNPRLGSGKITPRPWLSHCC